MGFPIIMNLLGQSLSEGMIANGQNQPRPEHEEPGNRQAVDVGSLRVNSE